MVHWVQCKSSSEQQFCKSDANTFAVLDFWSHTPSATGSYGRLADKIQVIFEFSKFEIIDFSLCLQMYSIITALPMRLRPIVRWFLKVRKIWKPQIFKGILLSTTNSKTFQYNVSHYFEVYLY